MPELARGRRRRRAARRGRCSWTTLRPVRDDARRASACAAARRWRGSGRAPGRRARRARACAGARRRRRLRDGRVLEPLRARGLVGVLARALDRLPGALVRGAHAAPRDLRARARAAGPRRARPRGAAATRSRGCAQETGSARVSRRQPAARARAARSGARAQRADASAVGHPRAPPGRAPAAARPTSSATSSYAAAVPRARSSRRELELGFGFDADAQGRGRRAARFELGGGVGLRGRIDRVDVAPRGEAVVYDYKSSTAPPRRQVGGRGQAAGGPVHARRRASCSGCAVVGGLYQPLAAPTCARAGLLDARTPCSSSCVNGDAREHGEAAGAARRRRSRWRARPPPRRARGRARGAARRPAPRQAAAASYPTICRCER